MNFKRLTDRRRRDLGVRELAQTPLELGPDLGDPPARLLTLKPGPLVRGADGAAERGRGRRCHARVGRSGAGRFVLR
jgi:hypothetical protein